MIDLHRDLNALSSSHVQTLKQSNLTSLNQELSLILEYIFVLFKMSQ